MGTEAGEDDVCIIESDDTDGSINEPVAARGCTSNMSRSPPLKNCDLIKILDDLMNGRHAVSQTPNPQSYR